MPSIYNEPDLCDLMVSYDFVFKSKMYNPKLPSKTDPYP